MPQRALISVYDKSGVVEFATALQNEFGYEIVSTGGTERLLREAGLKVTPVQEYTGFPEMLDGRVKTLHPLVHAGILAVRDNDEHMEELVTQKIGMIDMVVVNLYPFQKTVESGAPFEEVIEQIDVGGPTMLRAAAKNHRFVAVVASPEWYPRILAEMRVEKGNILPETRKELALEVFWLTAQYDAAISRYLSEGKRQMLPMEKVEDLRYGENPHQKGSLWRNPMDNQQSAIASAKVLHGKAMSFLNYYDADAALNLIREFEDPACAIIKHANPCGVAVGKNLVDAFGKAFACDSKSAFGGIVAVNRAFTVDLAAAIEKEKLFLEVIVAPEYEPAALQALHVKKNIRLLEVGKIRKLKPEDGDMKRISGGYLLQDYDAKEVREEDTRDSSAPSRKAAGSVGMTQMRDLLFAFKVVKHVKSNAIVLAKDGATVGIGAGQMSRVDSVELAIKKAGKRAKGSVLASDAFFPFPDSVELAAKAGISAIIQPGGSVNDEEVITAAKKAKIPMVFTGVRAFRH